MIVAAGLGTRLRPFTELRPKPALPVRGIPLIAATLALLRRYGVEEVVVNTHHLPDALEAAARAHCPDGLVLHFSREETLLDTGGGIRRVAEFLRESDPALLIGGDMWVDVDLDAFVRRHRERSDAVSLLLREDPRGAEFGTEGVDAEGRVRRIGSRFDLGEGEHRAGVYTWVNAVSPRAFDTLPDREVFSHFEGWIWPLLQAGAKDIRGVFDPCLWEPIGTPEEYLRANLVPPRLSYLDVQATAEAAGARFPDENVIGAGATIEPGARLRRVVVWDDEHVPAEIRAEGGVFAGSRFHRIEAPPSVRGETP